MPSRDVAKPVDYHENVGMAYKGEWQLELSKSISKEALTSPSQTVTSGLRHTQAVKLIEQTL